MKVEFIFTFSKAHNRKNNCFRIVYYADYNFTVVSHITYIVPANNNKKKSRITLTVTELPKYHCRELNHVVYNNLLTFNLKKVIYETNTNANSVFLCSEITMI